MTLQQLKYAVTVAEAGSITEAAKRLFISQPSLSNAIRELEREAKLTLFTRGRGGIALTREGMEFLGYARSVVQQMQLLEDKFVSDVPAKVRFGVSTQHYTFTANAFVEMVERFGQERYEFILNETRTHQIIEDVKNRFSDLGILYLSRSNEPVLRRCLDENGLRFHELFRASPHVFMRADHPLAGRTSVRLADLTPYPRLSFIQGNYESPHFAEELYGALSSEKSLRVSDRGAIVNLMLGTNAYTISSGIFPRYLQGNSIAAVPLSEDEEMRIGYILNADQELSPLGRVYIDALRKYGEI